MASDDRPRATGIAQVVESLFGEKATPNIGRDEAERRIREHLDNQGIVDTSILLSEAPVHRKALFDAVGTEVQFPHPDDGRYDRCFVALIDPEPLARWGHPAFWAFVPASGDAPLVLVSTDLPPHDKGPVRFVIRQP